MLQRSLIFCLLILIFNPGFAENYGQFNASAATTLNPIVYTVKNIDYGTLLYTGTGGANLSAILNPNSSTGTFVNVQKVTTSPSAIAAGQYVVAGGTPSQSVTMTFVNPVVLTLAGGGATMNLTPCIRNSAAGNIGSCIASGAPTTLDPNGNRTFYIGGTLTSTGAPPVGSYSGTMNITVNFN